MVLHVTRAPNEDVDCCRLDYIPCESAAQAGIENGEVLVLLGVSELDGLMRPSVVLGARVQGGSEGARAVLCRAALIAGHFCKSRVLAFV